jgi:cellulose synthase (UDP-forming)
MVSSRTSVAPSGSAASDRVRSDRVFRRRDWLPFGLLSVLELAATGWFLAYWLGRADWSAHPIAYPVLTVPLFVGLLMYQSRWLALPLMRRPRERPARPGWKVGVATTFVPGAESIEMLEETVRGLVAMDYPHDTWVLDEGDDGDVRALCERLGARHFSRRDRPEYQTERGTFESRTKHGNYNAWLFEIGFERYDVIVDFDPDHVPDSDFLLQVLGYFDDPEVGYVQAAQIYYNQPASFVARGAAEETYAYYSSIQMASYAIGYPIVTGCHNVHRASALREVGGFAAHEADDLLITMLYRARGWRGVYVPKRLAVGLTPVDWSGYLKQQRRWARSVLDVKLRIFPRMASKLRLPERVFSLVHGLYYLHGLSTALAVGLLCSMLVSGSAPRVFSGGTVARLLVLIGALELCDLYRQRYFLHPRAEWGLHWRAALLRLAKWPWVLFAAGDALLGRRGPYTITRKLKAAGGRPRILLPHVAVAALIAAAWGVGMARGEIANPMLDVVPGLAVAVSLVIALSALCRFPADYDPELRARVDHHRAARATAERSPRSRRRAGRVRLAGLQSRFSTPRRPLKP